MSPNHQLLATLGLPELPAALPAAVIDSHTHLDITAQHSGLPVAESLALAASVGVARVVQIGCDVESSQRATQLAASTPQVAAVVGVHPNVAGKLSAAALAVQLAQIAELAAAGGAKGVGETGLDYFRTTSLDAQERQKESFAAHVELAKQHDLTLVVHDRQAHGDVLQLLDGAGWPQRVIMHCFSGDAEFAKECLARGAWLSFPGTITFKNNAALCEALAVTPLERILVETDAPYLTPSPHRGKPNAPYLVPHTVRFIAAQLDGAGRGRPLAELCAQLWENTLAAYDGWGS